MKKLGVRDIDRGDTGKRMTYESQIWSTYYLELRAVKESMKENISACRYKENALRYADRGVNFKTIRSSLKLQSVSFILQTL